MVRRKRFLRWVLPSLLAAGPLSCGGSDCPKGSVRSAADGLCYLLPVAEDAPDRAVSDTATPVDSGEGGGTEPVEEPVEDPLPVADGCEPPGSLPADPLSDLGALNLQLEAFAEAVDIEVDPVAGLAVMAGQGGLMVADIRDPEEPVWVGHHGDDAFRQRYQNLELAPGGLVYATHWDEGLVVYDLLSSADPSLLFSVEADGMAGLALNDDLLYVVNKKTRELEVWDLTVPERPSLLVGVAGLGAPYAPFVHRDHVYVADNLHGLVVYDVSEPALPVLVGPVAAEASIQDLAFSEDGRTLYAAAGGAGLQVWSLDQPDEPVWVETLSRSYSVISVAVGEGLLWTVDQQEVTAFELSDPRSPLPLNSHRTGQWAMHVAATDTRAWVADWGYLRGYAASGAAVPDLNPASNAVYVAQEGGTATVSLRNNGGATLTVTGVEVSDPRVRWELADGRIEPGAERSLVLSYDGEGVLEATVCIASNDPDAPQQEVALVSGAGGGRAGVGVTAPDFSLEDLDGTLWRLSDLRGRPVVLAYFATW